VSRRTAHEMGQSGARFFSRGHFGARTDGHGFFKLMAIIMYIRFNEVNVIRLSTDMS